MFEHLRSSETPTNLSALLFPSPKDCCLLAGKRVDDFRCFACRIVATEDLLTREPHLEETRQAIALLISFALFSLEHSQFRIEAVDARTDGAAPFAKR